MPRIVIDAREYSTSTGRYTSKLIDNLQRIDNKNEYVVLLREKDFESVRFSNPNFSKVLTPYKEFTFGEQIGFAWQLYRLRADLAHFCMTQQPLFYLKRSVTTIHDLTTARFTNPDRDPLVFFVKQQIYKIVIWYAAHKSKHIITPSGYVKDDLVKFTRIRPKKISVIYEAANPIEDNPKPIKKLEGKQFIMYIGRPTPHKNLWRLIKAYDALKGMHPDLLLVLAGKFDGNYSHIERRVSSNGISGVVFTDYISDGELRWLYENCQAYVFPSLSEGFGLPGLEAMAHGAPVVSSNATCLPEIYGNAAHYFDPLDKQSMVKAIAEVLGDAKLRSRLTAEGKNRVDKYSWRKTAEETLKVYERWT
jgi:glycosyltransferase involved in cell wall biosynthesis